LRPFNFASAILWIASATTLSCGLETETESANPALELRAVNWQTSAQARPTLETALESNAVALCGPPAHFLGLASDYQCSDLPKVCFDVEMETSLNGSWSTAATISGSSCCCRPDGSATCYWPFPNTSLPQAFFRVGAHYC